ncbi:MAG: DDE-type integrase/transposase/recombinase [Candidatus Korobacteraceae bacterium]
MGVELWINKEAVRSATGWSDRTIRWKVQLGALGSRNASNEKTRDRSSREYALSSLPVEAQLKFLKQPLLSGPACTALAIRPYPNQSSLFASLPEVTASERLNFSPDQNAQALKRLEAIAPLVEFSSRSRRSRPAFRTSGGTAVRSMTSLADYLADQHHVSSRTLWNWYAQYRKVGYAGLVDRVRSDKGKSRFLAAHPAVRAFLENKYLGERLSIRLVYQALLRDLRNLEPECTRPPSYSAVRSYLKQLPKPLLILSREGKRQFQERCAPYLLTDFDSLVPNQIWVSDHGQHDVWVRNDLFSGISANAAVRPWLTAMIDLRSRKIVGTAWSASPSSHTISSALRVAIENFGIPQALVIDNGRDYEKIGRIDFSPECSGVLVRLGIQPHYCLPRHPQSKLIESWFGTVRKRFDCLWPSYCGPAPQDRPEQCTDALKEHQGFLKGKRKSSPLPSASEFLSTARQWITEYNSQHPHSGRGMSGRTPDEVFNELLPPPQRRLTESPEVLYALFWDRQRRKVSEGGCVQLYGERYEPADGESLAKLFLEIERNVLVACDPANLGEAIALDLDGRFLGRLRAQKLITRGPVSHDDIRSSMRIRRTARKAIADYVTGLSRIRDRAGDRTEIDHLQDRAEMPSEKYSPPPTLIQKVQPQDLKTAVRPDFIDDIVRELTEGE